VNSTVAYPPSLLPRLPTLFLFPRPRRSAPKPVILIFPLLHCLLPGRLSSPPFSRTFPDARVFSHARPEGRKLPGHPFPKLPFLDLRPRRFRELTSAYSHAWNSGFPLFPLWGFLWPDYPFLGFFPQGGPVGHAPSRPLTFCLGRPIVGPFSRLTAGDSLRWGLGHIFFSRIEHRSFPF